MKYIITEQQNNQLIEIILKYLNSNLVPEGGWKDKEYYQEEMNGSYEMFIMFDPEDEEYGDNPHMFYTECDNPDFSPTLDKCPLLTINSAKYDALDGFFGPRWQEIFKRWFTKHTGLPLKHVERQDW
jgi:hypothetical protein